MHTNASRTCLLSRFIGSKLISIVSLLSTSFSSSPSVHEQIQCSYLQIDCSDLAINVGTYSYVISISLNKLISQKSKMTTNHIVYSPDDTHRTRAFDQGSLHPQG